ncbi:MAG: rhamnulokinase [Calditrichaeota bacterium]|nr:MAG: rhamnulokinase [Calditrichota bacterium]
MADRTVISIDLGAESGRVMAVKFNGRKLAIEELHRFSNTPVLIHNTLYWDFLRLWHEIQVGLSKAKRLKPASIGVDTWGVDFGLLNAQGHLIGNPVHYRDKRTIDVMESCFLKLSKSEIYSRTGIQFLPFNTFYQLVSLIENQPQEIAIADTFLMAPDLINYWLTGAKKCEYTIASTTQLLNAKSGNWDFDLLDQFSIPKEIFPEIVQPGTKLGLWESIPVIASACHDTASAVAAVPAADFEYAYISSGTWSLVGLETPEPVINSESLRLNLTNEGGVFNTYRLLSNVMGLWILQQARNQWKTQGNDFTYAELASQASQAAPLRSLIKPDDPVFLPPGDHAQTVVDFCKNSNQILPESQGEIVRSILESLALAYKDVIARLIRLTTRKVERIHIVGGGSQNALLNQMTADATGKDVVAGPAEATVIGNALVQLITLGDLKDLKEARNVVAKMDELKHYYPQNNAAWEDAFSRYKQL